MVNIYNRALNCVLNLLVIFLALIFRLTSAWGSPPNPANSKSYLFFGAQKHTRVLVRTCMWVVRLVSCGMCGNVHAFAPFFSPTFTSPDPCFDGKRLALVSCDAHPFVLSCPHFDQAILDNFLFLSAWHFEINLAFSASRQFCRNIPH